MTERTKALGINMTKDGDIAICYFFENSLVKYVIVKPKSVINCLKNYDRQKAESQAKGMDMADEYIAGRENGKL